MTAPGAPGPVPLDPGICPPEARYPATIEARITNDDPTQCVPADPCLPDGTGLWTALPCEPPTVDAVTVADSTPPAAQLPATGLFEVGLVGAAVVSIGLGCLLRLVARDRRYRAVRTAP